ncbi:hypothetical protein U1Q18_046960 [Sarracenia purpurea var. burkii]
MVDNTSNKRGIRPVGPNGIVNSWSSSDANVFKMEHIWVINHYSFQDAKKEALKSSTFTSDFNESTKCTWYLDLRPKSKGESGYKDFIALFLNLHPTSECKNVFAKVRFSIMTSEQKEMHPLECEVHEFKFREGENDHTWGYWKFLKRDILFIQKKKLLPNDILTIFCQITYSSAIFTNTSHQSNSISFEPSVRLSKDFGSLLKNRKFADFTIMANGTEYPVHKNVLAARSTVFSAMFEPNGMQESEKNRIDITDIREDVMVEMLRYIYTGNVENLDALVDGLFEAADKYDLGELKTLCENVLINNMSVASAVDTLTMADMHHANELKSKIMAYIVMNVKEVMRTEGWKTLMSNLQLLNEVIQALADK